MLDFLRRAGKTSELSPEETARKNMDATEYRNVCRDHNATNASVFREVADDLLLLTAVTNRTCVNPDAFCSCIRYGY